MACGCDDTCNCLIQAGPNVFVSGAGTFDNPYIITAASETTFIGNNTDGGIEITPGGTAGHTPTFNLRLDPASTAPVSVSGLGLRVDCCDVSDAYSLDLTVGVETFNDTGGIDYYYVPIEGTLNVDGVQAADIYNLRAYLSLSATTGRVAPADVFPGYGIISQDTDPGTLDVSGLFTKGGYSYPTADVYSVNLVTNGVGEFEIGIANDTFVGDCYMVFVLPNGRIVISDPITFT